jgi:hypothetical protein
MQTRHQTMRRCLASALAAIAIMAIASVTMPAAAASDREPGRLAQEKTSVVHAADDIAPRRMSASVNREPMVTLEDGAGTLREALLGSPRLELFAVVFAMLFVTVGGLLAIYYVDRKNARHDQ